MKTTIPFLKLFNSTSNFFDQEDTVLSEKRKLIALYLKDIKGYSDLQLKIYLQAYDHFVHHKLDYDGATATEDLYDLPNLELASMLHDYLYIEFNCAGSFKYCWLVDKLFRDEMRKMNKSSWNKGARFVLLVLKSLLGYTFISFIFRNRRMTIQQKNKVDGIINVLSYRLPKKWYQEFQGEIVVSLIVMILITFVFY